MAKKEVDIGITVKKSDDFSEWYTQLVQKAELGDVRYNIKGLVVYMPWAAISIKKMYNITEDVLERKGHEPLIMPSLIPESNFKLEAEHVKGFAPEVFWVTEHGAGEKFEERMALRPTSETALYQMYSLWIRSYKDLPFKRYQSCQVWRCEGKMTRPFFRGREFHWIEAHDVFATEKEALAQVREDMGTTKETLLDKFAIPFIFFQRPQWDKFPGAVNTYAADTLMGSGKVLQLPSTHMLGQNFSKPFNVKFTDENGEEKLAWITCYGPAISRIYGAMISLHGDDKGLVLPWDVAPKQIVIVPVIFTEKKAEVLKKANELKKKLENDYEVILDEKDQTPGWKFNYWELKGVPIRVEVGPKDLENKTVVVFRRDIGQKKTVKESDLIKEIKEIESTFTKNLIKNAEKNFEGNIIDAKTKKEVENAVKNNKIARVSFCSLNKDGEKCAEIVEKEIQASVRGRRMDKEEKAAGNCAICGKKANVVTYITKSY